MPRISEESIRRVAEATDIVELIGSYFPLKRVGTSFRALCPFHSEKTPSFYVNPARQAYHCFGCQAGGTVFRFMMDYEHIEFAEAVRRLASRAGIPIIEEAGSADDDRRERLRKRLLAAQNEAATWFSSMLFKSADGQSAREYLKSRGVDAETAREWGLGYAPDSWDALLVHLRERGFSDEEMAGSGLASSKEDSGRTGNLYARFRGRLMFPIRNDYGETIAFSGRLLDPDAKAAKYVNSPETRLFTKGRLLYGLDKAKRALIAAKAAVVCEGQLDVIAASRSGIANVIAPQGTAFTPEQARLLARFVERVVLCFDSDRAGQEAISRSLPALLECGLAVSVAAVPEGHDPDSLIRMEGSEAFRAVIEGAKDFFDHALSQAAAAGILSDPTKVAAASRRLGGYAAMVADPVARDAVIGRICSRLGIAPATFRAQMRRSRTPRSTADASRTDQPGHEPPVELGETLKILCRNALLDPESRAWLARHGAARASEYVEGGLLLERIIAADAGLPANPDGSLPQSSTPPQLTAFATSLPAGLERALTALDLAHRPQEPLHATMEIWREFVANPLRQEIASTTAKLKDPDLPFEKRIEFQKQILDLQKKLNEVIRPAA
jgi:DNA primase